MDIRLTMRAQEQLNTKEQNQLLEVLQKILILYDGKLGKFTKYKVEIELKENAIPKAACAYPVANAHLNAFKEHLDKLVDQGVLEPAPRSQWIAGSFIIPKKDSSPCWLTDLRHLNQSIKCKV